LEKLKALSLQDTREAAEMFGQNGAFEMPYLASFGFALHIKNAKESQHQAPLPGKPLLCSADNK
jgi:hypothetical protein